MLGYAVRIVAIDMAFASRAAGKIGLLGAEGVFSDLHRGLQRQAIGREDA
jgi:hypothetical protein